jgi:hypothetical protein
MASTNKTMTTMIKIVTRLIEPFPLVRVSGAQSSRLRATVGRAWSSLRRPHADMTGGAAWYSTCVASTSMPARDAR